MNGVLQQCSKHLRVQTMKVFIKRNKLLKFIVKPGKLLNTGLFIRSSRFSTYTFKTLSITFAMS